MKKTVAMLFALILLLAGCAAPKQQNILPAEENKPSSQQSSFQPDETPDKQAFLDMFRETMFSFWVHSPLESPEDISGDAQTQWNMQGLLTWVRYWYDEAAGKQMHKNENGLVYFTPQEIAELSADLLGYNYVLNPEYMVGGRHGEDDAETRIYYIDAFGPGLGFVPNDESYEFKDGKIKIEAEISIVSPGEENPQPWAIEYIFIYMPRNTVCPYRLAETKLAGGVYMLNSETALSEDEAAKQSLKLYTDGYLSFLALLWGQDISSESPVAENDKMFYRSSIYETRSQLEDTFSASFTSGFISRNIGGSFSGEKYPQMLERDGALYIEEPGGIGGTYTLAKETLEIKNITDTGWVFTMNGWDMWKDAPNEELTWTFTVVYENGGWLIDEMHTVFSDGSGENEY